MRTCRKNGHGHGFMVFLQLTSLDLYCAGKWQSASNKVVFGGDRQSVGQLLKRCWSNFANMQKVLGDLWLIQARIFIVRLVNHLFAAMAWILVKRCFCWIPSWGGNATGVFSGIELHGAATWRATQICSPMDGWIEILKMWSLGNMSEMMWSWVMFLHEGDLNCSFVWEAVKAQSIFRRGCFL